MPEVVDPATRERCLLDVEAVLVADTPLRERLQAAAEIVGTRLALQRVVIYGDGQAGDPSTRVRAEWTAPGRAELGERIGAIPLVTDAPTRGPLVSSAPRGVQCPHDCIVSLPDCPLRGACSSVIQSLRLGGTRYGALAMHDWTGAEWSEQHVSLGADLARRVALEIAAARQHQVTEELDAQRAGIAATVLHQVATPVTVIAAVIDQLSRRHPGDSPDLLAVASIEVGRLRRMCDDLATIADGAAPQRKDAKARCDVATTVARSVQGAQDRHAPASLIELAIEDSIPAASCDPADLDRILGRVVDNAVLYAGKRARIDVSCWSDGRCVYVRVRDDGSGLSPAEAAVLGEPFARLDPGMLSQPGGRGLSLAIGRQLARGYGGDLRIEPRSDAPGAQVTVVLPVASPGAW